MSHIDNGYLVITRNDMTDIGTVESILDDLASEADPELSQRARDAQEFLAEVFDTDNLRYDDSVAEWGLRLYDAYQYDEKGGLKE